jgi:thymidylate synthase (FAD)
VKVIDQSVKVLFPRTLDEGIDNFKRIEVAGRNCWRSEEKITDDSYKTFIANLRKRGHESPLEFGEIVLDIMTSRDILAEITRHRLASFAVESQRYVNESKDDGGIKFIKPLFYQPFDPFYDYNVNNGAVHNGIYEASRLWDDAMLLAEDEYNRMISLGMKNQDARKVLPNSTACRIVMKINLRELLHIYALRSSPAAYPEMRELMRLLKIEVDKVYPGFLPEKEENQ